MKQPETNVDAMLTESSVKNASVVANEKLHVPELANSESGVVPILADDIGQLDVESRNSDVLLEKGSNSHVFFPCNREDALLFLGGLCISEFFPDSAVALALQPEGVALLEDGLRETENDLLNSGRPERFPVLIQVDQSVTWRSPRIIEYRDIIGLFFRTQSEADEFKFRPVDELDTETHACHVDSSLFGLDGGIRFSLRSAASANSIGRIADRLAAGVRCILSLGDAKPECRSAVDAFLSQSIEQRVTEELDFVTACQIISANTSLQESPSQDQRVVVSSFAQADSPSPREMLEKISQSFMSIAKNNESIAERNRRWVEVADGVIRNRIPLNGNRLSDDKSVLLRGALLALVAEDVDALCAFLDAEIPSGPRVTTIAAFLIGLKQGVVNTAWKDKKSEAKQLSIICSRILISLAKSPENLDRLFTVLHKETESSSLTSIALGDDQLVTWVEKRDPVPDALAADWLADFQFHGINVIAKGRTEYSWVIRLPSEQLVEVVHSAYGELRFPSIRLYLDDGQPLNKSKELKAYFSQGGRLWYPGSEGNLPPFLYCDLPSIPDNRDLDIISRQLAEVLALCLMPRKNVRKRKKKEPSSPQQAPL